MDVVKLHDSSKFNISAKTSPILREQLESSQCSCLCPFMLYAKMLPLVANYAQYTKNCKPKSNIQGIMQQ